MQVQQAAGAGRYQAVLAGQTRMLHSAIPLTPGSTVSAEVMATDGQWALRYLGTDEPAIPDRSGSASADDAPGAADPLAPPASLLTLAAAHKISLAPAEHRLLEQAMRTAVDPQAVALSGLFLAKLGLPVDLASLQSLAAAQTVAAQPDASGMALKRKAVPVEPDPASSIDLAALLAQALAADSQETKPPASPGAGANGFTPDEDGRGHAPVAHALLNQQDGGALAHRYGSLPVLIGDQLLELELVHFHPREPRPQDTPVRRLVMTLDTAALGRLQIEARSLNDRLVIRFIGGSPGAAHLLGAHAHEVRALASRLGWHIDGLEYEHSPGAPRAGTQIIRHVLSAGTLDSLL